jgi:hypothetical protein
MSTFMLLSFALSLAVIAVLGLLLRFITRRQEEFRAAGERLRDEPSASESDRESFAEYYRPMVRLLDPVELDRARVLEGIGKEDFMRFRRQRIYAFRSYLTDMKLDFHRVEFKIRYLMLSATQHEADIILDLNRLKSSFQWKLWKIQWQLFLFQFGVGAIDARPLVQALEEFEFNLVRRPAALSAMA